MMYPSPISAGERAGVVQGIPPAYVTDPIGCFEKLKWLTTARGNARKPSLYSRKICKPLSVFRNCRMPAHAIEEKIKRGAALLSADALTIFAAATLSGHGRSASTQRARRRRMIKKTPNNPPHRRIHVASQ